MSTNKTWGVYDTKDKCWIGDDAGPNRYVDGEMGGKPITGKLLAQMAATVAGKMVGPLAIYRFRAKPLPVTGWTFKDKLEARMTGVEAIADICKK